MLDIIICCVTNLLRIYLIYRFMMVFWGELTNKEQKKRELLIFILFFIINTSLYLCLHTSWVNLLCNIFGIFIITFTYSNSIKMNIFVTFSIYIVNMACDIVGTLLFINYEEGTRFGQFFQIVIVLIFFICVWSIEKIVHYRKGKENMRNMILSLVPIISIFMICITFYNSKKSLTIIISIGLLVINMLIFYLYNLLLKSFSEKYENEILTQKLRIYSNQLDVVLQGEEQVRILRHDLKHHIGELKILSEKQDVSKIKEYIGCMEETIQNPSEIVESGNIEIDSMLNYMLKKAKKELNSVDTKIRIPEKIKHSFDIIIILGNLLENAIEAAVYTEEKKLELDVLYKQGTLKIVIKNSYNSDIIIAGETKDSFLTNKKDKSLHGVGLRSVRRIVEKYDGIMDISRSNNLFCVKLLLYLSE